MSGEPVPSAHSAASVESPPDPDFLDSRGLLRELQLLAASIGAEREPLPGSLSGLEHLPAALPETGIGAEAALAELAPPFLDGAAWLRHSGFRAHMDPPTPWITWATELWAAALNQNLLHAETGLAARALETLVVSWLAPFLGQSPSPTRP
jgi:L-2,4-diaminobutyrate decarboxylase